MYPVSVRRGLREPALVFAAVLVIYLVITPQTSRQYRHFVYMADAFLDGRTDLRGVPEYYHDVIHLDGRVYAPFPPVPALVLLPVVAFRGTSTDQGRVGQVLAALAVSLFVAGLRRLGSSRPTRLFCGASLAFGSVLWPATAIGTTWFFAQIVVVLLGAVLIWELAGAARPLVLGGALAAAWLTRLSVLPLAPVLALLVWTRHRRLPAVLGFLAVNAAGALIYLAYNLLRFGDPLQTGYRLMSMGAPNAEAVARWGFFNARYIPEHLYALFVRAPDLLATFPYLRPSPWGMALVFTSPVILRLLFAADRVTWSPWGGLILATAVPMLAFFSVGWVQFGYRYSLDWWVFLLVLLAYALGTRPRPLDYALLTIGVAMNALGVYWVRALGW